MEANKTDNRNGQLQEGVGRINKDNAEHQNQEKGPAGIRDISDIDQQEGDMSNGVLGGNMGSIDREKDNNKQQ